MKHKDRINIAHLHLVGTEPTDLQDKALEFFDPRPGMTRLHFGGINAETGAQISMCIWQPTELMDKSMLRESEIPIEQIEARPVEKVKTNVKELQAYRDEKEMKESAKKVMKLLGL